MDTITGGRLYIKQLELGGPKVPTLWNLISRTLIKLKVKHVIKYFYKISSLFRLLCKYGESQAIDTLFKLGLTESDVNVTSALITLLRNQRFDLFTSVVKRLSLKAIRGDVLREATRADRLDLVQPFIGSLSIYDKKSALFWASQAGKYNSVVELSKYVEKDTASFLVAIENGHMDIVRFLTERYQIPVSEINHQLSLSISRAILNNQPSAVRYLVEQLNGTICIDNLYQAICGGTLDMVTYITSYGQFSCGSVACITASIFDQALNWSIVDFVITNFNLVREDVLDKVCTKNLNVVAYVIDRFKPSESELESLLVRSYNKEVIRYIFSMLQRITPPTFDRVLETLLSKDDIETATLFIERFKPTALSDESICLIARLGNVEFVKYLESGKTVWCNPKCIVEAARYGKTEYLNYYFSFLETRNEIAEEIHKERYDVKALNAALSCNHLESARAIITKFHLKGTDVEYDTFNKACSDGYSEIVQHLCQILPYTKQLNIGLSWAAENGHFMILIYLVNRFKLTAEHIKGNGCIQSAIRGGQIHITEYLRTRFNLSREDIYKDSLAFRVKSTGDFDTRKYLEELE